MTAPFLRLDIDSTGIRGMICSRGAHGAVIQDEVHVLYSDLPEEEGDQDPFEAGMAELARQMDFQECAGAVIFVPAGYACFRTLSMPFRSPKKIQQILPFELESHLPQMDEAYVSDFHLLDFPGEDHLILSGSMPDSSIEKYVTVLADWHIKPRVITPKGYAAAIGYLKQGKKSRNFVLLYISADETTMVLVNQGVPCHVRALPHAKASAQTLGAAVRHMMLGFSQRTGVITEFDVLVCSREGASHADPTIPVLEKMLKHQAGVRPPDQSCRTCTTVQAVDPGDMTAQISPDRNSGYLLNFCQGKYGANSFVKTYVREIAASAVLCFCCLILLVFSVKVDNAALQEQIARVDQRASAIFLETFPGSTRVQDPYLQMKANVQQAVRQAGAPVDGDPAVQPADYTVLQVIDDISRQVPDDIDLEITSFLFNKGRLVLSGSTRNFNDVDTIKTRIEAADLFRKVSISSAAADKKGDMVNFKFQIEL